MCNTRPGTARQIIELHLLSSRPTFGSTLQIRPNTRLPPCTGPPQLYGSCSAVGSKNGLILAQNGKFRARLHLQEKVAEDRNKGKAIRREKENSPKVKYNAAHEVQSGIQTAQLQASPPSGHPANAADSHAAMPIMSWIEAFHTLGVPKVLHGVEGNPSHHPSVRSMGGGGGGVRMAADRIV